MKLLFDIFLRGPFIGLSALFFAMPYLGLLVLGYAYLPWFEFSPESESNLKELFEFLGRISRPAREPIDPENGFFAILIQGLVIIYLTIMFFYQIQRFSGKISGLLFRQSLGSLLTYNKSWVFLPGIFLFFLIALCWWLLLPVKNDFALPSWGVAILLADVGSYSPWDYAIDQRSFLTFGAIIGFLFFVLFGLIGISKSSGKAYGHPNVGKSGHMLFILGSFWFLATGFCALLFHESSLSIITNSTYKQLWVLFSIHGLFFYSVMSGICAVLLKRMEIEGHIREMIDRGRMQVRNIEKTK